MRRFSRAASSSCINGSLESLRDRFPERAEREPGIVAHHFTQAGLPETAIEWWGRAGSRAMHRFANHEAALSYVNGLDLMAELPASEERDRRELAYRLALGPALLAARGYASDEVERNYQEAGRLAEALSDRGGCFHERPRAVALPLRPKRIRSRAGACRTAARHWDKGVEHREKQPRVPGYRLDFMSKGEFVHATEAFERVNSPR